VPTSFACLVECQPLISVPAIPIKAGTSSSDVTSRSDSRKAFDEGRYPVGIPERARKNQEPSSTQEQNSPVAERFRNRVVSNFFFCLQFGSQFVDQPVAFILRQPARLRRPVCQIEDGDDPYDDSGSPLHNEEPARPET
jgi:hypothetical protein